MIEQADSSRPGKRACVLCGAVRSAPQSGVPATFAYEYTTLTPREREVAMHIAWGLQNREIATLLGTSPDTVRKQTVRIYEKVGASGRTELAIWMTAAGYVTRT